MHQPLLVEARIEIVDVASGDRLEKVSVSPSPNAPLPSSAVSVVYAPPSMLISIGPVVSLLGLVELEHVEIDSTGSGGGDGVGGGGDGRGGGGDGASSAPTSTLHVNGLVSVQLTSSQT